MADLNNSSLMLKIMQRAELLRDQDKAAHLIPEYVLAAAVDVLTAKDQNDSPEERQRALALFERFTGTADEVRQALKTACESHKPSLSDTIVMQSIMYSAQNAARNSNSAELTVDILLQSILNSPTNNISKLIKDVAPQRKPGPRPQSRPQPQPAPQPEPQPEPEPIPADLMGLTQRVKDLKKALKSKVFGQDNAIETFVSGYFQAELRCMMEDKREAPRATFLFAGSPGVGKTHLAKNAAKFTGLPFKVFNMSEYASEIEAGNLNGSNKVWANSEEGLLTSFVYNNPRCIVLFDEIEKAHQKVIQLFLQILDGGVLRDNQTDVDVSFKDAILIFTTNVGRSLYEGNNDTNLSMLSRQVVLSALRKERKPNSEEPMFPSAICSRFAAGNVVMFNHLGAHNLLNIIRNNIAENAEAMEKAMDVHTEIDEKLYTALLMAESAKADARTVNSRAASFWSGEIYELMRLATAEPYGVDVNKVKKIRFSVNLPEDNEKLLALFQPVGRQEGIVFTRRPFPMLDAVKDICDLHIVGDVDEAVKLYKKRDIQFFLVDIAPEDDGVSDLMNPEDIVTPGRAFMFRALEEFGDMPLYVLEDPARPCFAEEIDSYLRRGARDILRLDPADPKGFHDALAGVVDRINRQQALLTLASSSKVVTFETSQRMLDPQTAEIGLFDFHIKTAVEGEDAKDIMSEASRPDVGFDDVIGADDAKAELQYFVSFLRNPKQFIGTGVSAPKGVLLYGPPGTGKTMLAKAMAGEAGVSFIAAEGNQFFNPLVGGSEAAVHDLFAKARKYAPTILFIDEIDSVGMKRSAGENNRWTLGPLTALLAEMDGIKTDYRRPVFVLAATNFDAERQEGDGLDPALMRRFDRRIFVGLPDKKNRFAYLKRCAETSALFKTSEATLQSIAERSANMSLAQLASMLELAKREALRSGKGIVDDAGLEEAFETFNSGKRKEWKREDVLRTARHEAGHTLINWLGGEKPSYVTVVSRGSFGGYMQHADGEEKFHYTQKDLLNNIRTSLGGRAAELVYYGQEDGLAAGASSDLRNATEMATRMLCAFGMDERFGMATISPAAMLSDAVQQQLRPEINRILNEQLKLAVEQITANRAAIDALVDKLMEQDHLNGEEIDAILTANVRRDAE